MFDCITIGDAVLDTFLLLNHERGQYRTDTHRNELCLPYGAKIPVVGSTQSAGGNALNVAVGLHRLGLKTSLATEIGHDIAGDILLHEIKAEGLNTGFVRQRRGIHTRYSVILNAGFERTVLSSYPKQSYTLPKLPKSRWVYYTSLDHSFASIQKKLLDQLKRMPDTKLAMNPGSYQIQYGIRTLRKILPHLDLLIVNKEEATALVGAPLPDDLLLRRLCKKQGAIVAITDGKHGVKACDGKCFYSMKALPVPPVGKTGAGDGFASGLLAALLHGEPLSEALRWGVANASGVIGHIGAHTGLMSKPAILRTLKRYRAYRPTIRHI